MKADGKRVVGFVAGFMARHSRMVYLATIDGESYTYHKSDAAIFPDNKLARRMILRVPDRLKSPDFGPIIHTVGPRSPLLNQGRHVDAHQLAAPRS